jgi:O-antigen ligase
MFFPAGSGLGTFTHVHEMYAPRSLARESYVNHAHDDWLELGLEAGMPAMVLALGFLAWYAAAAAGAWRSPSAGESPANKLLARAASVSVLLILLHSTVDYPLRTIAVMVMFAMCCALMLPPARPAAVGPVE